MARMRLRTHGTQSEKRKRSKGLIVRLRPIALIAALLLLWQFAVTRNPIHILPTPWEVVKGIGDLLQHGLLLKYVVASLFRVTWGFALAVLLAVPLGLIIGWNRRANMAVNPLLQILRPISPLAWIPIAILWFGVGDVAAMFLIFIASFLPLTLSAMKAVHDIDPIHLSAARNFDLPPGRLLREVLLPAILPQLLIGMRITIGIAWLVVVAAEMIAVNS